jgi:serine/threonine protein kinase
MLAVGRDLRYVELESFASYDLVYSDIERFEIISPIGSGQYSLVFLGRYDNTNQCAIQSLKNIPFAKIQRECAILDRVSTVVHLIEVVRDPVTSTISLVTEYHHSDSPRTVFPKLTVPDVRMMILPLLHSLDCCPRRGVMHRDVKPGNLLISSEQCSISLYDSGLADLHYAERPYTDRVSTLCYKAPELRILRFRR